MGNKSSLQLTLSFLFLAALCLEASIIRRMSSCPSMAMTWTEARLYCQKNYIDLINRQTGRNLLLSTFFKEIGVNQIWIGLVRDPQDDSLWKWINVKTGEGLSPYSISQNGYWADGQQSGHCALVEEDRRWYSTRCSSKHSFYCSRKDRLEHHEISLNWYDASQYCQNRKSELATITSNDTLDRGGWIGLYREAGEAWSWIGGQSSNYRNWAPQQPLNADCATFHPITEQYYSNVCSKKFRSACYSDNLVLVNENKTWEDALKHCWDMETLCADPLEPCKYYLLSLGRSDYSYVRDRLYRATTDEVWTGLRFLEGQWLWVNGVKLHDQMRLPDCPSEGKHCGTLSKSNTNNWITRDCSEKRNFICYRHYTYLQGSL